MIDMFVVFDASSLISVGQSCLINTLKELKEKTGHDFVVPESVFFEVVERPLRIKRFQLNAVRSKKAVREGWLEVKKLDSRHRQLSKEIEVQANNIISVRGKPVKLIQRGEAEALALTKQLNAPFLVIDERTTRTIIENPQQLKSLIERRQHKQARLNQSNANYLKKMFSDLSIVRSVEMIALAFEKGLATAELPKTKQGLEAALYALKYAGCAVSGEEITAFLTGLGR